MKNLFIILMAVSVLAGCTEQPDRQQASVPTPTPADHHQGYHRMNYRP
jgi:uncharacterized lipoprotein YajG